MQGFNMGRYVPPDLEGTTTANKIHKKHALGARASKLSSHGVLTVRFEMPFPIWCGSCPKPTVIGQGVRFNAEKKKVGSYYTTPVWSFRFRHADCGGAIEMRTDPKNTAYVVAEGATKRDTGPGDAGEPGEGGLAALTDEQREALRSNAFASLERTIEDRKRLEQAADRIHDLTALSARHWDDPYAQNQRLRKAFRVGRKERERDAAAAEDLKDRLGLGIDLLPATEEDAKRAALVDFAPAADDDDDDDDRAGQAALAKPLFASSKPGPVRPAGRLKAEKRAAERKTTFASEVMVNTRVSQDPFINGLRAAESKAPVRLPGVKRKRGATEAEDPNPPGQTKAQKPSAPSGLVSYDSD
ncbi:Protein saf4 [Paramyrothecium foliicola]|nr:Protein saf4 [Paramyrothecium foliicola]